LTADNQSTTTDAADNYVGKFSLLNRSDSGDDDDDDDDEDDSVYDEVCFDSVFIYTALYLSPHPVS